MAEAAIVSPRKCHYCGGAITSADKFCPGCGKEWNPVFSFIADRVRSEEEDKNFNKLSRATEILWLLVFVFSLSGAIGYFGKLKQSKRALANLADMNPDFVIPKEIEGRYFTVAQLQKQVVFELWTPVFVGLALAAVMAGLAIWSRRSPLPAILIASGIYAANIVLGTVINPTSLLQGLAVKIIVIVGLAHGIIASVNLRRRNG